MKVKLLLFLVSASILTSCVKEREFPSWDSDLLFPIIHTVLSPETMVNDSFLATNADSFFSLRYEHEIFDFSVDSLVQVPDTLFSNYFKPLLSITIQPGNKFLDMTRAKVLGFNNTTLSELRVKSGMLQFEVLNTSSEDIICDYTIMSATKNGQAFTFTETAPANSHTIYYKQYDFSGYSVDLRGVGLDSVNTVLSNFQATLHPDAQALTFQTTDSFYINIHFVDLILDYAKGYFGNRTYVIGPESAKFDVFGPLVDGTLDFEQANFSLNLRNGFGVDSRLKLRSLQAENTRNGSTMDLTGDILGKNLNLARAIDTDPGNGPVIPTILNYDLSNTNMEDVFEMMPDRLTFELDVSSNPLGNVTNNNDFMYYGEGLGTFLAMDIPLALRADTLLLEEQIGWYLDLGSSEDNYLGGILTASFTNGFPMDARIDAILLDKDGIAIDTLLENAYLNASISDSQGRLIETVNTRFEIVTDQERLDDMIASRKIILRVRFNTTYKPGFVRFYPDHTLDIQMIGDFKIRLEP